MGLLRAIIWVFIVFWLLFLVFSTFLSPPYQKIESIDTNLYISKYNKIILNDEGIIVKESINDNNQEESLLYLEKLSYADEIYTNNLKWYDLDNNIINLNESWTYIFNFNDLNNNYIINHKWFNILPKWYWVFYVDIISETKIKIFSVNNLLELWFKDIKDFEVVNRAYLFPHEYFYIDNLLKNRSIKDNDFIRVKDHIYKWAYVSNPILIENSDNSRLSVLIWDKWIEFLILALKNIYNLKKENLEKFNKLESYKYWWFPWVEKIKKYISFFYNDSKKIVYYKNILINDILKLFSSDRNVDRILINNIKSNLGLLKDLDKSEYDNIILIIDYYVDILSLEDSIDNESKKINFSMLKNEINWIKNDYNYSLLYLKSIYNLFEQWEIDDFSIYLNKFISYYFEDNNISLVNDSLHYDSNDVIEIDYLLYFLKWYILWFFENNSFDKWSIDFINTYIIINRAVYFEVWDENRVETWVIQWLELLDTLIIFLRNTLFKKELEKWKFLVVVENNNISKPSVENLKQNINNYLGIIDRKKNLIENIDILEKYKLIFSDYFSAYLTPINYRIDNEDIFNKPTIFWTWNVFVLSRENFTEYISQFNDITESNLSKASVEIIDEKYYIVENLYIKNKLFSFELYPLTWNILKKVIINRDKWRIYWSEYNLDLYQKIKEEEYKNNSEDETADFKNIFSTLFFPEEIDNSDTPDNSWGNVDKCWDKLDSLEVRRFKWFKLLWDKWDFYSISRLVDISYCDLNVDDDFNIYVNWPLLTVSKTLEGSNEPVIYNWLIYSNYIFESHEFEDFQIKLYRDYSESNNLLFSGNPINFVSSIYVLDLEEVVLEFVNNKNTFEYIYDLIYSELFDISNLLLSYDHINSRIIVTFYNFDNNIEIIVRWDNMSVLNNWENISGIAKLTDLKEILLNID